MEGRGRFRAVRPAEWALCSQDLLLRRRSLFRGGLGRRSGIASRSLGSRSFGGRRYFGRSRRGFLGRSSSFFLLTTAGAQQKGNRNGAPHICIHRQLPQVRSVRKGR